MLDKKTFLQFVFGLSVFISRFIGLPANFSALGSFGFFSKNTLFFFAIIISYDLINGGFYNYFYFTYLAFLSYLFFGHLAKDSIKKSLLFLPLASFFFFLISNFGSFLSMYEYSVNGLTKCYINALPFYKNTLLGDLFFGYSYLFAKQLFNSSCKISNLNLKILYEDNFNIGR